MTTDPTTSAQPTNEISAEAAVASESIKYAFPTAGQAEDDRRKEIVANRVQLAIDTATAPLKARVEELERIRIMRTEQCCECNVFVSDWVEADHRDGRICRPCEAAITLRAEVQTLRAENEARGVEIAELQSRLDADYQRDLIEGLRGQVVDALNQRDKFAGDSIDLANDLAQQRQKLEQARAALETMRTALKDLREQDHTLQFDDGDVHISEFCERALANTGGDAA